MISLSTQYRIRRWFRDHEPMICGQCGHIHFRKDIEPYQALTGQRVNLCRACRERWGLG